VGPQTRRSVFSDTEGYFRFPGLESGSYSIEAELLGLRTARVVQVFLEQTTTVQITLSEEESAEMAAPARSDLIEVEAVAPLVDRFRTQVGATVNRDFLDELPVTRFYQSVALLLPGVVGGEDGNPNVSGSLREGNLYLIDGVDTTDPTTGLFGLNLNFEAIEEVSVTTAAPTTLYGRFSGALINVVTQSGTDDFRGTARWLSTSADWDEEYEAEIESINDEIDAVNTTDGDLNSTWAATLAGPLVPERLWFFAAFESGTTTDTFRPTLFGDSWNSNSDLEGSVFKITWQPTDSHTIVAQQTADSASFADFSPFDRSAGENQTDAKAPEEVTPFDRFPGDLFALENRSQDGEFSTIQWFGVPRQNLAMAATVAVQSRVLERQPLNSRGVTGGAIHEALEIVPFGDDLFFSSLGLFNGITDVGREERDRIQADVNGSWFFRWGKADHDLKLGVDYQRTDSSRLFNFSGTPGIDRATGRPVSGQYFQDLDTSAECLGLGQCQNPFDPESGEFLPAFFYNMWERQATETEMENIALFFEDSIVLGRWLLTFGARFDSVRGQLANGEKLLDHDAISPRLGFKFDPRGEGKEFLFATYSELYEPFDQRFIDSFLTDEIFSGFTEYAWTGAFGDDCTGEDPANLDSRCWFPTFTSDPLSFRFPGELTAGLERTSVQEFVAGFERQLTPTTAVRLAYIDRTWDNLWDDIFGFADPANPSFLDLTARVENIPTARREYRGIQLLLQKRFSNHWQLLGSYTWSEAQGNLFVNDGTSDFADFSGSSDETSVNRFGPAPYDSPTQIKIFSNYQVPLGRGNLSLGTVLRYSEGTPYERQTFGDFSIRFLTPRGSIRLDDVLQWDLSAAFDFDLVDDMEARVKFEVFNVTDEQTLLGVEPITDFSNFGDPKTLSDIQRPRNFRLSVGIQF